jgi:hypothetical protein
MEERGRFRGATKLLGAGGGDLEVVLAGMEKSISFFEQDTRARGQDHGPEVGVDGETVFLSQ